MFSYKQLLIQTRLKHLDSSI